MSGGKSRFKHLHLSFLCQGSEKERFKPEFWALGVLLCSLYQIQGKNSFLESENPFSRFYYTEKVEFDLSSGL
jgi:hypothetical protein